METVKIKWRVGGQPHQAISNNGCALAWVSKRSSKYTVISAWHSCRETFAGEIRTQLWPETHLYSRPIGIKFGKLRIAVNLKHTFHNSPHLIEKMREEKDAWIERALKLVHIYEDYLGWPRTVARRAELDGGQNRHTKVYLIEASPKWMRSTQLMSLYLLLIRVSRFEGYVSEASTVDEVREIVRKTKRTYGDKGHMYRTVNVHKLILDNMAYLFGNLSIKQNYSKQFGNSGITSFAAGNLTDVRIKERWKRVQAKAKSSSA